MSEKIENQELLNKIIIGRVEPHIYAFSTNTVPNYLKVGDTYRPVKVRLEEWKAHYPTLKEEYSDTAQINSDVYFRDYSVHDYLEHHLRKTKLERKDINDNIHYSNEFFKDTTKEDVKDAIEDIKDDYEKNTGKYKYYNAKDKLPEKPKPEDKGTLTLRDDQKKVVNNFIEAKQNGQTDLLMYAVMRFGKTVTSLMCAKAMDASFVLIVSGKADVGEEWKKTCTCYSNFKDEYVFINCKILDDNSHIISECLKNDQKIIVFLTLQDLKGDKIKERHKEIFENKIDLLIVDETHFAARAPVYGCVLKRKKSDVQYEDVKGPVAYSKEEATIDEVSEQVKKLHTHITLHLSGTPYRILMGREFKHEDIICHCQFSDIVDAQKDWDEKNLDKDEWENPYYGFPQMIRFAFHPSKAAKEKLDEYKSSGRRYALSDLLAPMSITKDKKGLYKKFVNEKEVLELFQVIDGTKDDENVLGFLDYEPIKKGCMCRHIVCVLPFCASCDALEELISNNTEKFKNLNDYRILNISGLDGKKNYKSVESIKNEIKRCESKNQKTLTLTVNRMLTGVTVEEWDTMIYLKNTSSSQEYDQSIFRLQNQYIKEIPADDTSSKTIKQEDDKSVKIIKQNMKPQTLLIDFDPNRVFTLQEERVRFENYIENKSGNEGLSEKIQREIEISPIITINKNRIEQITANNIMDFVTQYASNRGVIEETMDIPVDTDLMNDSDINDTISKQAEIGTNGGLKVGNTDEESGSDYDMPDENTDSNKEAGTTKQAENKTAKVDNADTIKDKTKIFENKFRTYYARILFYAFLVENPVESLNDIISTMSGEENAVLAQHLDIDKDFLKIIQKRMYPPVLSQLDYKINNISKLAHDDELDSLTRVKNAMISFNRLSESEVVTPQNICEKMVGYLSGDELVDVCKKQGKVLDIAGKVGEFAIALYERLTDNNGLNQDHEAVRNIIYTIPTSAVAFEFTKKIYKILDLNVNNIAPFTSYDLLDLKVGESWEKLKDKIFCGTDIGENAFFRKENYNMKFDFIIGNPPYQEEMEGTSDNPIYNYFMDGAYSAADKVELISPARFLFNAGKTPKSWNKKMLNDPHLKVLYYEQDSSKIFANTDIKGGVAITYRDAKKDFGAIETFIQYDELNDIKEKVVGSSGFESLSQLVYAPESYKFTQFMHSENPWVVEKLSNGHLYDITSNIFDKVPQLFYDEKPSDDYIGLYGILNRKRVLKWIKREYVKEHDNLNCYKVFVPKSNASGTFGEVLSTPVIGEPSIGHTQSFISIGKLNTESEAKNLLKYIKTKFARAMLGILKITQDNKKSVWQYVPLQDFTSDSDIDWSKPIHEIDQQLYAKYGLSDDEIEFIESHVKEMN